jgi:two-component system sensor histidine kinase ChiS
MNKISKRLWYTKLNKIFRRHSLANDFIFMVSLFVSTIILLAVLFTFYLHNSYNKEKNTNLVAKAKRIEYSLTESFDYVSNLLKFFGHEILKLETLDPVLITKVLRGDLVSEAVVKRLFSWTVFDWIDSDNRLVLNTSLGEVDKAADMSHRSYVQAAPREPWVLNFSSPDIGIKSGQWVIPAGMGVTDESGKYLGTVALGFDINNLTRKLEQDTANATFSYIVLTDEYKIVTASADNQIERTSDFYLKALADSNLFTKEKGFLERQITHKDIDYSYYHKVPNRPYIILVGYNRITAWKTFYNSLLPLIFGFTVIGLLFIYIAARMRKTLVAPIVELAGAASRLSKSKELRQNIYITRPKTYELHMLAKQIVHVQSYFRRLRISNHELAIAKEELEEANNNLKRFMRILAHDICSPLSSALGFAEIIKDQHFGKNNPQYIEYAGNIQQIVSSVIEIVNELVDAEKIEERQKELKNEMVSVEEVLDEVIAMESHSAKNRGIEIIKQYSHDNPYRLISERKYILRICINLLSNAIKYSPKNEGKKVWIKINADDNHLSIIFKDEGYGIDDIHKAVKPFNNLKAPNFVEVSTNGLGLYSVKQMLENLHGGELDIESTVGKGTTIICRFPYSKICANTLSNK